MMYPLDAETIKFIGLCPHRANKGMALSDTIKYDIQSIIPPPSPSLLMRYVTELIHFGVISLDDQSPHNLGNFYLPLISVLSANEKKHSARKKNCHPRYTNQQQLNAYEFMNDIRIKKIN